MTEGDNRINELKFVEMACTAMACSTNPDPCSVLVVRDRAASILCYFEDRPHIVLCDDGQVWIKNIKVFLASFAFPIIKSK